MNLLIFLGLDEMLFKYDKSKNELFRIEDTTFTSEGLTEPKNIEAWIRKNPGILYEGDEEELLIIGEQKTSETKKRLDLLGVDKFGNIVIIELKRDLAEKMVESQAITYASSYVYTTFAEVCKIYAKYLEKNSTELSLPHIIDLSVEAENTLKNFCGPFIKIPEDFNKNQRIILVAGNFSQDLLSAVTWLILKGIKIECIKLNLFKDENELFVQPQRILPTPDISENIVKIKIAEESIEIKSNAYQKWSGDIEEHYERLASPLNDDLRKLVNELGIEPTNLSGSGFHLINETKKIMISTYVKSKIEFRFAKSTKEEIDRLLVSLGVRSLQVKEKADIEPYGIVNPTPSIDYRKVDDVSVEEITRLCKEWLNIGKE